MVLVSTVYSGGAYNVTYMNNCCKYFKVMNLN